VTNGLLASEFEPVVTTADAADFVFVGELRMLKGVDVALDALAIVNRTRCSTAIFVGAGPDSEKFKEQSRTLRLESRVKFAGPMRARQAFAQGRVLLMPSRAESLPYIVLEAVAAGLPVLATDVGGIPEIINEPFGPLLPPGDAGALAIAMLEAMEKPDLVRMKAEGLQDAIRQKFTVEVMASSILDFYNSAERMLRAA
jgi:glycosyltransferase involved in cell wall biosynthesis